jgi:hypothetical protein
MRQAGDAARQGEKKNANLQNFDKKTWDEESLVIPWGRLEENIKMELTGEN